MKKRIVKIILALIIVVGTTITLIMGLNYDLPYSHNTQLDIIIGKEFKNSDIYNIVKEVTGKIRIEVKKVELYQEEVSITADSFTDEQIESIVNKINEQYEINNTVQDVNKIENNKIRGRHIINPYIVPVLVTLAFLGIYTMIIELLYFTENNMPKKLVFFGSIALFVAALTLLINSSKNTQTDIASIIGSTAIMIIVGILLIIFEKKENKKYFTVKLIFYILLTQAIYLSLIAITRLPVNRLTMPISMLIYISTIMFIYNKNLKNLKISNSILKKFES